MTLPHHSLEGLDDVRQLAKDADVLQNGEKLQSLATYMQLGADCAENLLPSNPHLQLRENMSQRGKNKDLYICTHMKLECCC